MIGDLGADLFGQLEGVVDAVVAAHVEKGARPVGLLAREEETGRLVRKADLAVAVKDEDRVLDLVEEGFLELALFPFRIAHQRGLGHVSAMARRSVTRSPTGGGGRAVVSSPGALRRDPERNSIPRFSRK